MHALIQGAGGCLFLPVVFRPGAANQQPVGIDADGGAGDEGTQVFPFHNVQRLHLIRFHGENLIHPVGQHLVQHMQVELIPDFQLVQIGKQLRFRHAPVAGQGAVGAFAAQRIAGF